MQSGMRRRPISSPWPCLLCQSSSSASIRRWCRTFSATPSRSWWAEDRRLCQRQLTPLAWVSTSAISRPEIILTLTAIAVVLLDLVARDKRILAWLSVAGVVVAGAAAVWLWTSDASGSSYSGVVITDLFGTFFKLVVLGGTLLALLFSPPMLIAACHDSTANTMACSCSPPSV